MHSTGRCAARTQAGRARSGRGATDVPGGAAARARQLPPPSPARPSPRWRWPASRASVSSTTSITAGTGRPTTTRTRWAMPCSPPRARPASASPCSTRCYLHGGLTADGYSPTSGVQLRFADADADAWAERVDMLRPSDTQRIGAAIHSVRAVDPTSMERVATRARRRAAPRPRLRADRPRTTRALRITAGPRSRCSLRPARCRIASPQSTPRISPTATSGCSAPPDATVASVRRPSATSPTASVRRTGSHHRGSPSRWGPTPTR